MYNRQLTWLPVKKISFQPVIIKIADAYTATHIAELIDK